MRILVVEDDTILLDGLTVGLGMTGFSAEGVETLEDARHALATTAFEGIVLDIMLPDGSGTELLRELRQRGSDLPVLLLTARDQVHDRVAGLDAGADDYLGKPFDLDEVAARLRALMRRRSGRAHAEMRWNGLAVDPASLRGTYRGTEVSFSRREFAILSALLDRPGTLRSRADLEDRLYGWDGEVESNTVEVHVHRLRAKLGRGFIETVRGVGYRLAAEREAPCRSD